MKYVQLIIKDVKQPTTDILIAELSEEGFESFEETSSELNAYIQEDKYQKDAAQEVIARHGKEFQDNVIEQENWNATWESSFEPVVVKDFCVVRASFHDKVPNVTHDIVITPKMSFGTGHHATTRLMIEQMSNMDIADSQLLDFGTGTGVLAILAHHLGAANITAIDNDEWSYENTIENIEQNDISGITVHKGSLDTTVGHVYDIILANINRHILLEYMSQMSVQLSKNGFLLLSGILADDVEIINGSATRAGLRVINITEEESWRAILLQKI